MDNNIDKNDQIIFNRVIEADTSYVSSQNDRASYKYISKSIPGNVLNLKIFENDTSGAKTFELTRENHSRGGGQPTKTKRSITTKDGERQLYAKGNDFYVRKLNKTTNKYGFKKVNV
jgi:hypothetical protein